MTPVEKRRAEDCYFFSSFLVEKLLQNGLLAEAVPGDNDDAVEWNQKFQKNIDGVKKWTEHINIFLKKFIYVPVHIAQHWSLIVVCNPGNIGLMNPDADADEEIPAFVCMDSLKIHPLEKICEILRKYLIGEWNRCSITPLRITARNFPAVFPEVPVQENLIDCGVFLLKYAAWFFDACIEGRPILLTRKSVEEKLKGVVDNDMFR